jgi:hypothetical protein
VSALQLVLHVPAVPHRYWLQVCAAAGVQVPAPSHLPAGVYVPPVQVLAPHDVPAA